MFDNWIKLKRGATYKTATLSTSDRAKLDEYLNSVREVEKRVESMRRT